MTFLNKLDKLMADNKLNKKTFSNNSGIAYTTIVNWYKRGYDNMSISILKKICDYFGVTMDSMARDELEIEFYNPNAKNLHITNDEEILLRHYRSADKSHKELAKCAVGADKNQEPPKESRSVG